MSEQPTQVRKRLEEPDAGKEGRMGCMVWGGVLGIIAGIMFALYGLPPILKSIYGEEHVEAGATYEGDAKQIRVLSVSREGGFTTVLLSVQSNKTWAPELDDFQLEYDGADDWVEPEPPVAADSRTSLEMPLGEQRELLLRFQSPGDLVPKVLHLTLPRVRFELPPQAAP